MSDSAAGLFFCLVAAIVVVMSAVDAMPPYSQPSPGNAEGSLQQQAIGGPSNFELSDKPLSDANSASSALAWIRYVMSQSNKQENAQQEFSSPPQSSLAAAPVTKRFSEFSVPYLKYRHDKRNDGIWIWMPAQGYVSVPKQQQAMEDLANGKPGKIMRYGRK